MNEQPPLLIFDAPDEYWEFQTKEANRALDFYIENSSEFKASTIALVKVIAKNRTRAQFIQMTCMVLAAAIERLKRLEKKKDS